MSAPLGPLTLLSLLGLFLLPFVDFSCQGRKVMTATGYELAFGKEVKTELPVGELLKGLDPDAGGHRDREGRQGDFELTFSQKDRAQGRPLFALAILAGAAGGLVALVWRTGGMVGGLLAAVLLLVAQSDLQKELQEQQVPLVVASFLPGFWASLAASVAGAFLCLVGGRK